MTVRCVMVARGSEEPALRVVWGSRALRSRLLVFFAGLALGLSAGCAAEPVIVAKAPPPLKAEEKTRKPNSKVFWKTGHWAWKDDAQLYYWVDGAWEAERDGWIWFPGEWEPVNDANGQRQGWRWVEDRWVRRQDAGLPD